MIIGILGEDISDAETIKAIIGRLGLKRLNEMKPLGFGGRSKLLNDGANKAKVMRALHGVTHLVVCHDSDGREPEGVRERVTKHVVNPSGFADSHCLAIPVRMIEAWIAADPEAIRAVIPCFECPLHPSPEQLEDPKKWLIGEARLAGSRGRYRPATHNSQIAQWLDIDLVASRCESFARFRRCVMQWAT